MESTLSLIEDLDKWFGILFALNDSRLQERFIFFLFLSQSFLFNLFLTVNIARVACMTLDYKLTNFS